MSLSCIFTAIDSPYLAKDCTGLGNTLFQIASVYGLAKDSGREPDFSYLNVLNNKLKDLTGHDYTKTIFRNVVITQTNPTLKIDVHHYYHEPFLENLLIFLKSNQESIVLYGHLESHKFFTKYINDIQTMFQPDGDSKEYIISKYPEILRNNTVSIHIRNFHTNFTDDMKYVEKAMENFSQDSVFFVMSNDSVEENFKKINKKIIFVKGNTDFQDLWIISMCKHNILSHSTMSWWGAFLNTNHKKTVICPKTMQNNYPGPISNFYLESYTLL
jgi:predicted phosphodiesterase